MAYQKVSLKCDEKDCTQSVDALVDPADKVLEVKCDKHSHGAFVRTDESSYQKHLESELAKQDLTPAARKNNEQWLSDLKAKHKR